MARFLRFCSIVTGLTVLTGLLCVGSAVADITGIVFNDFDGDGFYSSSNLETGIGGMEINAYDASGALAATTVSYEFNCTGAGVPDASCLAAGSPIRGQYVLTGLSAAPYRIEYVPLTTAALNYLNAGAGSGTSVEFATDGDLVDVGFMSSGQYCNQSPDLVATCYARNLASEPSSAGVEASVLFNYDATGRNPALKSPVAFIQESTYNVGSVWGIAYNPLTNKLYHSSVLRANSGVGDGGLGAIHETDLSALPNSTSIWASVPTVAAVTQSLFVPTFTGTKDPEGYQFAGKIGLGDIDISSDYTKLYVMNLDGNGLLYEYDIASATVLATYPVNDPGCSDPTDVRPWAVKVQYGEVYIGVTCSEEAPGGTDAGLSAHVMQLTPGAAGGDFTTILTAPLGYTKQPVASCAANDGWFRWNSNLADFADPSHICSAAGSPITLGYPTPILSDIEFDDDGSIIMGFIDRFSIQTPHFDVAPDPADVSGTLYQTNTGGDIIRACFTGASYILEGNPGCGPAVGEYYTGDEILYDSPATVLHAELALGGLAILPGSGEVVSSVYDPLDDDVNPPTNDSLGSQGIHWYSNATGAKSDEFELVAKPDSDFAKGTGLGDVEVLCALPPVEVGNYIWEDLDGDGVQDAGELPLAGVTVELYHNVAGAMVLIGTAVTDANGRYLFSNDPSRASDTTGSFIYDIGGFGADGLPNTSDDVNGLKPSYGGIVNDYKIVVPPTFGTSVLTINDAEGDATNTALLDIRDSDGILNAATGNVEINFSTGAAGQNNQSLDIGYAPPTGTIGDTVWIDANGDGIIDPTETRIPGVTIKVTFLGADGVLGGTDDQLFTAVTDASGNYLVTNLPFGNYNVMVDTTTLPAGLVQTYDFDGTGDDMSFTTISIGAPVDLDQDFGYNQLGTTTMAWNGFCDQQNFASMQNTCTGPVNVVLELFGSAGNLLGTDAVTIASGSQVDFSINGMPGFTMFDYGVVNLTSQPGGCITGNMGLFAPIGEGQFFSSEIRDSGFGGTNNLFTMADGSESNACYAVYNTFQPSLKPEDQNYTTTHWLQLQNTNADNKTTFTINRFDSDGNEVVSEQAIVNPFGRVDIAAGHEDIEKNRYGLVEIVPDTVGSDFSAQLFRYGVDSGVNAGERMSSFNLADNCSVGHKGTQYVTVSKGAGASSWLEVYNINRKSQTVNVRVLSNISGEVASYELDMDPMESIHLDATIGFTAGESGVVEVVGTSGSVLVKASSYIYDQDGGIATSVTTEGQVALASTSYSSFNTFRDQINWLRAYNVGAKPTTITIEGSNGIDGKIYETVSFVLDKSSGQDINLNQVFGLDSSSYGRIKVSVSGAGQISADIIRVENTPDLSEVIEMEVFNFQQ